MPIPPARRPSPEEVARLREVHRADQVQGRHPQRPGPREALHPLLMLLVRTLLVVFVAVGAYSVAAAQGAAPAAPWSALGD